MAKVQERPPEGYRMTELGPLPDEWEVVELGDIANVCYGKAKPKTNGVVPVIGSGGTYAQVDKPLIDFSTLIIGRKGTAGKVWLAEGPCWPSDTTFYLEWKQPIEVRFLHGYFLLNPLSGEHAKTTLPSLQRPDLENLSIPLPPLPEQRAIAYVLRAVQEAKEATERVIAAARELKKSLMRHLFTYGPVPVDQVDQVPLKETEIGPLSAHWQVVRLGEVADLKLGRTPPRKIRKFWDPGELHWVSIADLNNNVVAFTKEKVSEAARKEIFKYDPLPIGTLLLSFKLSIGKVGMLGVPAYHNEAIVSVFPSDSLDKLFAFYVFQNLDYARDEDAYVKGKTLSKKKLQRLPFPLPPLPEQREIARILQTVDKKIEAEENRKEALEALFKSLLRDLMTARRRLPPEFVARFAEARTEEGL